MNRNLLIAIVVLAIVVIGGVAYYLSTQQPRKEVTIVVLSPEWEPGKILEQLSANFTSYAQEKLGYPVKVVFDFTPWGTYYQRVTSIVTARSSEADIIFSDSQWLGELFEGGHIIDLTDWINNDPDMKAATQDTYENLVKFYMTYPQGSNRYVGVPGYADAVMLLYYRKDLFNDPVERANFKAKYGYDLPSTLEDFKRLDWLQLKDIAEFFTRRAGETLAGQTLTEDFYGITLVLSRDYDYISCSFLSMFWSWGAELWNPSTMDPRSYINSTQGVEALQFLHNLTRYMPPSPATYDYDKVITTFAQGKAAMTVLWPSMAPALFDPATSRVSDKIGVAILPQHNGVRYITLGGQPLVISSYSNHKEEAKLFIKWFYTVAYKDYSLRVGFTARKSIAQSSDFVNSKPWARAFVESLPYAKDFWNIPFYGRMLEIQQKYWNMVVAGQIDPKTAMDKIAEEQWGVVQQFKK
ncbi:extracellular solute-binding protein family 1 [Desulfurococcus mucosus DSM 2162]|uniref:Extracellular solute-binding protein family 1 n=2 Tax=Desulfurococcus mucosus TaxID=2275 RepID=E8R8K1_DESM0|nr:extracellular solute-binding protein [Desulfurococcus mucosus]ADV64827.1 extracellular solute-binding protein family 1 [Desulfurococcus mucosus DSM 2162]